MEKVEFILKRHRTTIDGSHGTGINDLHEDILVDIICRLSLTHITKFKIVSKSWNSLISNRCIPKLTSSPIHALLFNTFRFNRKSLFIRSYWYLDFLTTSPYRHRIQMKESLPFEQFPSHFLDCCNGITLYFDPSSKQYYLCNVSTQQVKSIPNSPRNNVPKTAALVVHYPYYKIVHISGSPATMNIFCLKTEEWSAHQLDLNLDYSMPPRYIFVGESLYRLSGTGYVFKFNVMREIGYRMIQLPESAKMDCNIGCIGVSQGSLHFGWDDQLSKMMVWTLKDADEWVLKYTVSLEFFARHPLCTALHDTSMFDVIAFHPTSDEFFVGNCGGIFCFHPGTKRLEVVTNLSKRRFVYGGQDLTYPFSINLTPLNALVRA